MNKKGFTIAEVIVSFSLVSVILASMIGSTIYYRDKVKEEEVITQLIDFKNMITNTIYDDIIIHNDRKITSIERCIGTSNCVNFVDKEGVAHTLSIVEHDTTTAEYKKGVYLSYDNTLYMLPDSDLGEKGNRTCDFVGGFEIDHYNDEKTEVDLYTVKTVFKHRDINKQYDIMVTLTNYYGTSNKINTMLSVNPLSGTVISGETLTVPITTDSDGELSCSSSNENIATCSITGTTLTINGISAGNAIINISQEAGVNYSAASTVYTANVANRQAGYITLSAQSGDIKYWEYKYARYVYNGGRCIVGSGSLTKGSNSTTFTVDSHHGGELSCTSSNTSYATCSIDGTTVNVNRVLSDSSSGTVTITVTSGGTNTYTEASAIYTVNLYRASTSCSTSSSNSTYTNCSDTQVSYAPTCNTSTGAAYQYCCLTYTAP